MLTTLGYVALIIGVVLVAIGYTVEGRALRPGWGCVILGVVLVVIGYVLPAIPAAHAMGLLDSVPIAVSA